MPFSVSPTKNINSFNYYNRSSGSSVLEGWIFTVPLMFPIYHTRQQYQYFRTRTSTTAVPVLLPGMFVHNVYKQILLWWPYRPCIAVSGVTAERQTEWRGAGRVITTEKDLRYQVHVADICIKHKTIIPPEHIIFVPSKSSVRTNVVSCFRLPMSTFIIYHYVPCQLTCDHWSKSQIMFRAWVHHDSHILLVRK